MTYEDARAQFPVLERYAYLQAGSALQRFGVFEAGVASTRDPRYVVTPQRERLERAEGSAALAVGGAHDGGPAGG